MMQPLKTDKRPLHVQVRQHLLGLIEDNTYQPGEQLPSEADLAEQLGVSRPTLREALFNLEREGAIVRRHGVGTFVASDYGDRLKSGLERLESVLALASRQGMATEVRGLRVDRVAADETLAERLELDPGAPLMCVCRTIAVKRGPAAYLVDYVPIDVLSPDDLDEDFNGSVLDLLIRRNAARIREALAEITAVDADDVLGEQLDVEPGRALLLLTETLFTDEQVPIEFSRNYFLPDLFRFHVLRR
jgi:GntR family transcriptional regulator